MSSHLFDIAVSTVYTQSYWAKYGSSNKNNFICVLISSLSKSKLFHVNNCLIQIAREKISPNIVCASTDGTVIWDFTLNFFSNPQVD